MDKTINRIIIMLVGFLFGTFLGQFIIFVGGGSYYFNPFISFFGCFLFLFVEIILILELI